MKGTLLRRISDQAEGLLARRGWPCFCVVGETEEYSLMLRCHALANVPRAFLQFVETEIRDTLPCQIYFVLTSWSTNPRAFFKVPPEPFPAGSWSNILPAPAEACGTCGTRAVFARRCGFCGARG